MSPAEGGALRIVKVELAGFGLYARPTRVLFPEAAGVLCSPNESGKSTLLHAISAVLFGLPNSGDPSAFGNARFRSFGHAGEFWGAVVWESGDRRFRLHRAFDSHQVRLLEETAAGPQVLYSGEHNPMGRSSSASSFAAVLREHFGFASIDLFRRTFCLTQPVPEDSAVDSELQHLLSGSRSGRVEEVLSRLFSEMKALTRATGDLGIARPGTLRPSNRGNPGRIEAAQDELERLRRELEEGSGTLERLNASNQELELAEERIGRLQRSVETGRERLKTLEAWLAANQERRRRSESIQQARAALSQLDELDRQASDLEPLLAGRHAPYRNAPKDLPELLEGVEEAERERERAAAEESLRNSERAAIETEAAGLSQRLASELRDVRGRPELLELRESLERAWARREERRAAMARRRETVRGLEGSLAELSRWEGLDPAGLRRETGILKESVERQEEIGRRLSEIEGQTEDRRFLSGERLEALRGKIKAEDALKEVSLRLRELEAGQARIERAEAQAQGKAAEVRAEAVRAGSPAARIALASGAGMASGSAALLVLALGARLSLAASLAVGAAVFVLVLVIILAVRSARPEPSRKDITQTPRTPGAPVEDAAPAASPEPIAAELEKVRSEQARLRAEALRLGRDLGPFQATTARELAGMEERWSNLEGEASRLSEELRALSARRFGEDTDGGSRWQELPASSLPGPLPSALRLPGAPAGNAGEMVGWLLGLSPQAWESFKQEAARREETAARLGAAASELRRLEEEDASDREPERLAERLAPFSRETPPETLQALLEESAELERKLRSLHDRLQDIPSPEALESARVQAEKAVGEGMEEIARGWPEFVGPAGRPVEEWARGLRMEEREARSNWQKSDEIASGRGRILSTARAASREDLSSRELEQSAALGLLLKNLEELEEKDPLLAGGRELPEAMAREIHVREGEAALKEEVEGDDGRLAQARRERDELLSRLAELKGSRAPNLARLEVRIRRLEEELTRLERERDAIALAYQWVREAAETFQATYREELEARMSARFEELTGVGGRRLTLDESFRLSATEPGGETMALEQLSQGARDQLSFALRLAVADLLAGAVPLPLFLDDPFVHYDAQRLGRLRDILRRVGASRQWILLTHDEDLAPWGEPVRMEEIR